MSSYSIVYPKPLPPLENQTLINDNGFALTEIAALRNGWRLINRRFMYHSRAIFMGFFEENENFLEQFRDQKGKLNMSHLHQHPQLLLSTYGNLIMKALDDSTYINVLMTDISQRHRIFGVTYEHIKLITDYISCYILNYLQKVITPTFISGLEKVTKVIMSYHQEKDIDIDAMSNNSGG